MNMHLEKRLDIILIFFLFLTSLLIRLNYLTMAHPSLSSDDAIFMTMARYFYEGKISGLFHPVWMPLFPFISSLFFPLVKNWVIAASFTSVVSGALLVIPLYLVGKIIANRITGFVAAFLTIFLSYFIATSTYTYSESLLAFAFWMGILFYLRAIDKSSNLYALLSGLFFGFTFLAKTEGFIPMLSILVFNAVLIILFIESKFKSIKKIFPLIIFAFSFVYFISSGFISFGSIILIIFLIILYFIKKNVKTDFKYVRIMLFALTGFFSVYLSFNFILSVKYQKPLFLAKASSFLNFPGYWTLNKSKTSTWIQDMNSPDTFNPNSEFATRFLKAAKEKQDYIVKDALVKISVWLKMLFGPPLINLIFLFIGFYWLIMKYKDMIKKMFLLFIIFSTLVIMAFIAYYPLRRYIYWFSPIIPLGIGLGFNYIQGFLKNTKLKAAFLLFYLLLIIKTDNLENHSQSAELNKLVKINFKGTKNLFFQKMVAPANSDLYELLENKRIVARYEGIAFNNKSFLIYSPETPEGISLEVFIKYIKSWKADYVIASPDQITGSLDYLYLKPKDYPGLKLVFKGNPVIYKVLY